MPAGVFASSRAAARNERGARDVIAACVCVCCERGRLAGRVHAIANDIPLSLECTAFYSGLQCSASAGVQRNVAIRSRQRFV